MKYESDESTGVLDDENIRERMFAEMTYRDRLTARLVCHKWNREISTKFSFIVRLNEECSEFVPISNLPLYSIRIEKLTEVDWTLKSFAFPKILAHLKICGPISLTNLELFLVDPNKFPNIRLFEIDCDQIVEENEEIRKIKGISKHFGFGIPFPNLRFLRVRSPTSHSSQIMSLSHRIFNLLLLSRFQELKGFSLMDVSSLEDPTILQRLFKFLFRHGCTLRNLCVKQSNFDANPLQIQSVRRRHNFPLPYKRQETFSNMLSEIQLKNVTLAPPSIPSVEEDLGAMLSEQKEMRRLHAHFPHCPFLFYKSILHRNCNSLKELVISNLTFTKQLNLTPFSFCTNLQILKLSRDPTHIRASTEPINDLTHLRHLPSTLTCLHIKGFGILTDEIYGIGTLLPNLHELDLVEVGNCGMVGVSGRSLKHLFINLSQLENLGISGGFNVEQEIDDLNLRQVISEVKPNLMINFSTISQTTLNQISFEVKWAFGPTFPNPYVLSQKLKESNSSLSRN